MKYVGMYECLKIKPYQKSNPKSKGDIRDPTTDENTMSDAKENHQDASHHLSDGEYCHEPCVLAVYAHRVRIRHEKKTKRL